MNEDVRAELGSLAASLRAYLEWQRDTGAAGIPRAPRNLHAAANPSPVGAVPAVNVPVNAAVSVSVANVKATTADVPSRVLTLTDESPPHPIAAITARPAKAVAPTMSARERLPLLQAEVAACTRCTLSLSRTQTVFSRGNPSATLCFIGEAPGADEDAQGQPFVGRAGQLLDKMIGAMGLSPENDVYVCNIIKCRPPENRKPESSEIDTCIPYLHEQLQLVKPKVIVAMGNTAVGALLGTKLGITKLRGEWKLYKGTTLVMPTYHPSYLLRPSAQQVEAKKHAWEDLQSVMRELKLPIPPRRA